MLTYRHDGENKLETLNKNNMRLPRKIKKSCKKYLVLGAVLNTNSLRYTHVQCNKKDKNDKAKYIHLYVRHLAEVREFKIY